MLATYRGNTYETKKEKGQERTAPVLVYRGVKYKAESLKPCRACSVQSEG